MRKKIVFIIRQYPPIDSPTCLSMASVIKSFSVTHDVYCLTDVGGKSDDVSVIPFPYFEIKCRNKIFPRIGQLVTIPFYPVTTPLKQIAFNRFCMKWCKKIDPEIIVSVCFPIDTIIAGSYIKNHFPSVKYIPCFIDAYSCGKTPKYLLPTFARNRKAMLEKWGTRNADKVIYMESARQFYEGRKGYNANKVYLNPAFMSKIRTVDYIEKSKEIYTILYTGYLPMPERDPSYFIRALEGISNVRVVFIGKNEALNCIEDLKKATNVKVECIDFLPHDELTPYIESADFLLNLGVENCLAISGKIFEYFAYRKPIINIFHDEKDAALIYLNKYPLCCSINQNNTSIEDAKDIVSEFIKNAAGKRADVNTVNDLYYTSTPEAYVKEILDE